MGENDKIVECCIFSAPDSILTFSEGCLYKFKMLSETRRKRNFSAPHMFDM